MYQIILLALIFPLLIIFLPSKSLPWNWPLVKLLPTAYLKSHELYDKLTQVLAENDATILCKTSWYTNVDTLVTSDPRNVQHVLTSRASIYQRGSEFRKVFDFLGDAVFVKDNMKEWREAKKLTHGFFKESGFHTSTSKNVRHTLERGLVPVLRHASEQTGDHRVLDLQEVFSRYMIDTTCLMATGVDLASLRVGLPPCPLLEAMDDMADAVFWRNVLPERVWRLESLLGVGTERNMARACAVWRRTLDEFLSRPSPGAFNVLDFYTAGGGGGGGDDSPPPPPPAFLAANIMTLFFAARDTSAALLTWLFHLIDRNPNVKRAILGELRECFPSRKEHIFHNGEELSKLVYLHCALMETLRLFPPAPVIMRDPAAADVLPSGHRVGENTRIVMCSYAMGRAPAIWGDDCGEFRPERWMGAATRRVASHSFLAFGSGPWACPGREVAFARMKGVAATVLHNFEVEVLVGERVSPSVSAFLNVKDGLKASISSRWPSPP